MQGAATVCPCALQSTRPDVRAAQRVALAPTNEALSWAADSSMRFRSSRRWRSTSAASLKDQNSRPNPQSYTDAAKLAVQQARCQRMRLNALPLQRVADLLSTLMQGICPSPLSSQAMGDLFRGAGTVGHLKSSGDKAICSGSVKRPPSPLIIWNEHIGVNLGP
jgi:hypothetical protein